MRLMNNGYKSSKIANTRKKVNLDNNELVLYFNTTMINMIIIK